MVLADGACGGDAIAHVRAVPSIGVAPVGHGGGGDPAGLLRPAGAALYRAQEGGRNRVEVADEASGFVAGS